MLKLEIQIRSWFYLIYIYICIYIYIYIYIYINERFPDFFVILDKDKYEEMIRLKIFNFNNKSVYKH